jgi:hypothetical protein
VADDLTRLLAYDGAIDDDPAVVTLGPEIFSLAFWTPAMAAAVIRAAEAVNAWEPDPDDPVPGQEVSLRAISPRLFAHVEDHCYASLTQWPAIDFVGIDDAFVIRYDPVVRPELPLHHDVGQVSASVRLNDDYEGGQLEFPRQEVVVSGLAIGRMVTWPSLVTHPHRSTPVTRGIKYGLTIWFTIPGR